MVDDRKPAPGKAKGATIGAAAAAIIAATIALEGGWVNNPADPGGETKDGITKRVAVKHGYTGPMRELPREVATSIYYDSYLVKPGYAPLVELDAPVAEELFDTTVNMGALKPSRWFQQSINALCGAQLAVDGRVGPGTIAAYAACQPRLGAAPLCEDMLALLDGRQLAEYQRLVRVNPRLKVFYKGWVAHRIGNVDWRKCGGPQVSMKIAALEAATQHSGTLRSADSFREIIPPGRFQGDVAAIAIFAQGDVVRTLCARASSEAIACSGFAKDGTPMLVAPNPCLAASSDLYAAILCHELGHLNGWPAEHGD